MSGVNGVKNFPCSDNDSSVAIEPKDRDGKLMMVMMMMTPYR
jgi:hypothetical protein